jgi:hypothetical protein
MIASRTAKITSARNAATAAKIQSIGKKDEAGTLLEQATHAATRAHGPRSNEAGTLLEQATHAATRANGPRSK